LIWAHAEIVGLIKYFSGMKPFDKGTTSAWCSNRFNYLDCPLVVENSSNFLVVNSFAAVLMNMYHWRDKNW